MVRGTIVALGIVALVAACASDESETVGEGTSANGGPRLVDELAEPASGGGPPTGGPEFPTGGTAGGGGPPTGGSEFLTSGTDEDDAGVMGRFDGGHPGITPNPEPDLSIYGEPPRCEVLDALAGRNACMGRLIDHECDGAGWECAENEEIDAIAGQACTQCVPEGTATTAGDLQSFLTRLVHDSCQNRCGDDSSCFAWRIASTCGVCDVILFGGTDEEVLEAARVFDADHCEGNGAFFMVDLPAACVDGVCVPAQ